MVKGADAEPVRKPYVAEAACCERPGCLCLVAPEAAGGGPVPCPDPVRWTGTFRFGNGEVWRAFACDGHQHRLRDPHPLTADDQAYLAGLERQWVRALAGKRWARPAPLWPPARRG